MKNSVLVVCGIQSFYLWKHKRQQKRFSLKRKNEASKHHRKKSSKYRCVIRHSMQWSYSLDNNFSFLRCLLSVLFSLVALEALHIKNRFISCQFGSFFSLCQLGNAKQILQSDYLQKKWIHSLKKNRKL